MSERLKERASINDQLKMLGRLARRLDSDPRHPLDVLANYFNMAGDDYQAFIKEYRKDGDDPLEV